VSGYLRVDGVTDGPDTDDRKTSTATCTGGRVAIGGGYELTTDVVGDDQNLTVVENRATSNTVWTVTAAEDDLSPTTNWTIQAYVTCAQMAP
jgi:hypothetical protein